MINIINKKIKELNKLCKENPNFEFYDCEMEGIGEDLEKYLKTFAISILEKQYEELKEIKGEYAIDELEYHKEKLQKDIKQIKDNK